MTDCNRNNTLPPRLLRGVTRTVKITVVDKNEDPVDLSVAREVTVRVSMDGRPWSEAYVPGISISGEGNNLVTFTWYADVQKCGRYTIDVNADFGNRNQSRVDFHREFGVELVEHSCDVTVVPEDAMEIDDEVDLEGTLEVTTDGMSAFDQWRTSPESEGYPPTEEGFFAWIRQPATDAATAAATQMGVIQGRADEDHRLAAADHTLAGTDHGTAVSDHTRAASDHGIAANDHTQAGQDHTTAASDHTIAGQDHTQAGQDHTQAGNDHTTAAADHTIAGQDHTQAGNDHTRAGEDHTQAGNDHTRAESDHTRAEQDHTRAEQDHASVGEAVKYTQQTLTDEQQAQARTNIGAGTYSKPSGGIPAADIANGVIPDISGKADKVSNATNGNFAALDSNGNLTDSGHKHSDYITSHQDITGKADKVSSATNGHLAALDGNGNLADSGKSASDFATAAQGTKADTAYQKPSTGIPASDIADGVIPTVPTALSQLSDDNTHRLVTDTEKSTWNGKQGALAFDSTPTADSTNPVTSGGVKAYVDGAIPTVPTISTDIQTDKASTTKTASPSAVYNEVHPAIATTQPSGGFLPNVVYDLGTVTGTVTFSLASASDVTIANAYFWTFETSSTAPTITWPSNITWAGGSAPTISASKHYEIMIRNGYGTFIEI